MVFSFLSNVSETLHKMQVSLANNVKVYNLSQGKTLPEWLSDRRKRALQKSDSDLQRRIQLIQDFDMPTVATNIKVSPDGQYILCAGVYKPRVKCYDVSQLSMKFERCLDSEVVKFHILSEDYSKMVFLQADRYVEFHAKYGRYHRLRIPKFGRDMAYHTPSCDLFLVGTSPEIYRLNLEQGQFLSPFVTDSIAINACSINPVHHLLAVGTIEGRVECWDPRVRRKVGVLDCALSSITSTTDVQGMPSVSSLAFKDGLHMAVGTSTGQVLIYDIRSDRPVLVKDHHYGLPIHTVDFHPQQGLVISSDAKAVKLWDMKNGEMFTSLAPEHDINDVFVIPDSGLLLMASESPKMGAYFIPSLGPAPKWCSFLDSLTEELEESSSTAVYDDYKFVTKAELENLGLNHLIGSGLLRAYMHGYFMDIRLYHKAKSIADPFAYEQYRKGKIKEKIEAARANRVQIKKLPKVNASLANRLQDQDEEEKKTKKATDEAGPNLLQDDRFAALFKNPEFQVDQESEEYRMLHPLVSKEQKKREKKLAKQQAMLEQFEQLEEEPEGKGSDEDSSSSDEDDQSWRQELRDQHKQLREEQKARKPERDQSRSKPPKFYELKAGEEFSTTKKFVKRKSKATLGERVENEDAGVITRTPGESYGSKQLTFKLKKSERDQKFQRLNAEHHRERKKLRRSAGALRGKSQGKSNIQ